EKSEKFSPRALEKTAAHNRRAKAGKPLGLDLGGEAAPPIAVILDGGFAPGRRTPVGQTFALRQFEDASGDQHLERGGDHAIPIGASMDGFFGPPLTVMHGCAATGEQSGGDAGGG